MVGCANFVVVVADSSKIGHEEFVSFAPVDSLDVLVTDAGIGSRERALTATGLEVVVAQGPHKWEPHDRHRHPNPSIDRTVTLPGELVRGAVHRVTSVSSEPGGRGVNVARALTLAGLETVAVLPAGHHDPFWPGCRPRRGVPRRAGRRRCSHQPHDHRRRRHHDEDQ